MYEVDFSKPIHIHFIGIGGISMSGLAEILLKENFTISGSDAKESDLKISFLASTLSFTPQRSTRTTRNLPPPKLPAFRC